MGVDEIIREIEENWDFNRFASLCNELYYAEVYHLIGKERARTSSWCSSEYSATMHNKTMTTMQAETMHEQGTRSLRSSDVYKAAVRKLGQLYPETKGKIAFLSIDINQPKRLETYVRKIQLSKYPMYGMIGGGVSGQEVQEAKQGIISMGLQGHFIDKTPDAAYKAVYLP